MNLQIDKFRNTRLGLRVTFITEALVLAWQIFLAYRLTTLEVSPAEQNYVGHIHIGVMQLLLAARASLCFLPTSDRKHIADMKSMSVGSLVMFALAGVCGYFLAIVQSKPAMSENGLIGVLVLIAAIGLMSIFSQAGLIIYCRSFGLEVQSQKIEKSASAALYWFRLTILSYFAFVLICCLSAAAYYVLATDSIEAEVWGAPCLFMVMIFGGLFLVIALIATIQYFQMLWVGSWIVDKPGKGNVDS